MFVFVCVYIYIHIYIYIYIYMTLTCTDWLAPVVVPSAPQRWPGRRFGLHRQRGIPTYSIGVCLTPWTSHIETVYDDTSRAAHVIFPYIVVRARCHRIGYACCFCLCAARMPACSHRRRAIPPHHRVGPLPAGIFPRAHDRHLSCRRATTFTGSGQMARLCTCP